MSWLDIVIGVILFAGLAGGLSRGFFRTLGSLLALVIGAGAAFSYYRPLALKLPLGAAGSSAAQIAAFILIFIVVALVLIWLGNILARLIAGITLGWLDRLLGGVLGVAIGLVVALVGLVILFTAAPQTRAPASRTFFAPRIVALGARARVLLPPAVRQRLPAGSLVAAPAPDSTRG